MKIFNILWKHQKTPTLCLWQLDIFRQKKKKKRTLLVSIKEWPVVLRHD